MTECERRVWALAEIYRGTARILLRNNPDRNDFKQIMPRLLADQYAERAEEIEQIFRTTGTR